MQNLHLEIEKSIFFSPYIDFNATTGVCEMAGESFLEDPVGFYEVPIRWLESFEGEKIIFKFKLTYFNTSSSKCILGIVRALKQKKAEGKEVYISWYYPHDNYDLLAEGEDFMADVEMPFTFISYHLE
jgi:hypothetical protein